MADIVIREVTKDVWTFSKPFLRFSIIPVGGRSTAIKLTTGDVWVLASTPLGTPTKDKLNELGPVKYIVCGDAEHTIYLREFKAAYPEAKLIGIEPIVNKASLKDLKFDGVYGKDSEGTKYGFEDEIKSCYFSGFKNKDVAFLHTRSKTLVEADLLFNLPAKEQFSKSTTSSWFPFVNSMKPYTAFHRSMVRGLVQDKAIEVYLTCLSAGSYGRDAAHIVEVEGVHGWGDSAESQLGWKKPPGVRFRERLRV